MFADRSHGSTLCLCLRAPDTCRGSGTESREGSTTWRSDLYVLFDEDSPQDNEDASQEHFHGVGAVVDVTERRDLRSTSSGQSPLVDRTGLSNTSCSRTVLPSGESISVHIHM